MKGVGAEVAKEGQIRSTFHAQGALLRILAIQTSGMKKPRRLRPGLKEQEMGALRGFAYATATEAEGGDGGGAHQESRTSGLGD